MRELLTEVAEFLEVEADNRAAAGSEMSDYEREPRELAERVRQAISAPPAPVAGGWRWKTPPLEMADANLLHALKSIEDERFDDESLKDFIVAAREALSAIDAPPITDPVPVGVRP